MNRCLGEWVEVWILSFAVGFFARAAGLTWSVILPIGFLIVIAVSFLQRMRDR